MTRRLARGSAVITPRGNTLVLSQNRPTTLPQQNVGFQNGDELKRVLDNLQKRVSDLTGLIAALPFTQSVYRRDVEFTISTNTEIEHGLRGPVGYLFTRCTVDGLWTETANTSTKLTLYSLATCVADMWIFSRPA